MQHQSAAMAKATPMTPRSSQIPSATDRATRTTRVQNRDRYMVKVTSPAARIPLEKGPEMGKATALNRLWITTSQNTRSFASGDRS